MIKIKNKTRLLLLISMAFFLNNCSTYTVKNDFSLKGDLKKTPRWYVKFDREDAKWMYETASSVSPDLELSVKKSTMLAKAKLADRINGKMNNQTSISKEETGSNEKNMVSTAAEDTVVNIVGKTLVRHYIVDKVELYYTRNKSYRSYVKLKVSKENVQSIIDEIKSDKQLLLSKKQKSIKSKAKEVLKNID